MADSQYELIGTENNEKAAIIAKESTGGVSRLRYYPDILQKYNRSTDQNRCIAHLNSYCYPVRNITKFDTAVSIDGYAYGVGKIKYKRDYDDDEGA